MSDEGDVYRGSHAWIVCLWALKDYREWSFRFAQPALLPLARGIVEWVSTRRHRLSRAARHDVRPGDRARRLRGALPATTAAARARGRDEGRHRRRQRLRGPSRRGGASRAGPCGGRPRARPARRPPRRGARGLRPRAGAGPRGRAGRLRRPRQPGRDQARRGPADLRGRSCRRHAPAPRRLRRGRDPALRPRERRVQPPRPAPALPRYEVARGGGGARERPGLHHPEARRHLRAGRRHGHAPRAHDPLRAAVPRGRPRRLDPAAGGRARRRGGGRGRAGPAAVDRRHL